MVAPDEWKTLAPGQLSIYDRQGKPGVVWYRFGKGEVIWWAISSPASNGSIREKGNLALLLNSVGPPGSRILWDEYFHGMRRSLGSYFAATPLPWAGLQIAIVFAVRAVHVFAALGTHAGACQSNRGFLLWNSWTRWGACTNPRRPLPPRWKSCTSDCAWRFPGGWARQLNAKLPALCAASEERLGWPADTLFHTLSDAERAMRDINLENGEALDLVRSLHGYLHRLDTQRKPAEERPSWK